MSHLSPLNRSTGNVISPDVINPAQANTDSRLRVTNFNSANTEIPVTIGALVGQNYLHHRGVAVQTMLNQHVPRNVSYTQVVTTNDLLSNGAILVDSANNIWMQPYAVMNNQGKEAPERETPERETPERETQGATQYNATMYFAGLSLEENFREAVDLQATKIEAYTVAQQSFNEFFEHAFDIGIKANALIDNNFTAAPAPFGVNHCPHDKAFYALPISINGQTRHCYWIEDYSPRQMLDWWRENPDVRNAGALLPPRFPFPLDFIYSVPNGNIALVPNMQFNTPQTPSVRFTAEELQLAGMQQDPLNSSAYFCEEHFPNSTMLRHQWYPHFNLHENNLAAAEFRADSGLPVANSTQTLSLIRDKINKQPSLSTFPSTSKFPSTGEFPSTDSSTSSESNFNLQHLKDEGDRIDIDIIPKESMPRPRSISPALAPDLAESWERQRQEGLATEGAKTFFLSKSEFVEMVSDEESTETSSSDSSAFVSPSPLQFNDSVSEMKKSSTKSQATFRQRQETFSAHDPILVQGFSDEPVSLARLRSSVVQPTPLRAHPLPQQQINHPFAVTRVVHGGTRPSGRPTRSLAPNEAAEPKYTRFANTFTSTVPVFTTAKSETVTRVTPQEALVQRVSSFSGKPLTPVAKKRTPSVKTVAAPTLLAFQPAIFTSSNTSSAVGSFRQRGQHANGFEALLNESRAKVEVRPKPRTRTEARTEAEPSQTTEELLKYFNLPSASSAQIRAGAVPRRRMALQPNTASTSTQPVTGTSTQSMLKAMLREQRRKQQLSENLVANPTPTIPQPQHSIRASSNKHSVAWDNAPSVSVERQFQQPQPSLNALTISRQQPQYQWTQLRWQSRQPHPQDRQTGYLQEIASTSTQLSEQAQQRLARNNSQSRNNRR